MTQIWWAMWALGVATIARRVHEDSNNPREDPAVDVFAAGCCAVVFLVTALIILAWG